jgi:hypothetical protein
VFWTVALAHSVQVNPGAGTARLRVNNLAIRDYTNIPNALALGNFVAATVSFEVIWSGPVTRRVRVRDATNGFAGEFVENKASLRWSATETGFRFESDPPRTSISVFAEIGHERNGIFFLRQGQGNQMPPQHGHGGPPPGHGRRR